MFIDNFHSECVWSRAHMSASFLNRTRFPQLIYEKTCLGNYGSGSVTIATVSVRSQKCNFIDDCTHPAGDVLWVFVEPGNVVPYISVAGHRCWLSRAKHRLKIQKFLLV